MELGMNDSSWTKSWSRGLDVTNAAYANVAELMFFFEMLGKSCGDQVVFYYHSTPKKSKYGQKQDTNIMAAKLLIPT